MSAGRKLAIATTAAESEPPTVLLRRDDCIELMPGSIVDEIYEIDSRLGEGAMGEVYAARHLKLGKRVAIKVIGQRLSEDAAAIERFAQEAQTLAQIQHPAIVAVDHVGELADGRAYFSMEFLRGESLKDRLARGRVPLDEALRILDQMARGLEAAHSNGVTHRDLKPENTYLADLENEAPVVKLLDFGLAKLAVDVDRRSERTQSGVAIGTPMYMSPEQARGPNVDHRTDIYALGAVAYELLLGRRPFEHARTVPELFAAHLHEAPPLPRSIWPEIPPQLDLALFAMLAKNPSYRPTLSQIRLVIATVVTARASTSPGLAATEMTLVAPPTRGKALMAVIVGVAMLGGIVIGAAAMRTVGNGSSGLSGVRAEHVVDAGVAMDAMSTIPAVVTDANVDATMPASPQDAATATVQTRDAGAVRQAPPKSGRNTATTPTPLDAGVAELRTTPPSGVDAGSAIVVGPPIVDAPSKDVPIDAPRKPPPTSQPVRPAPAPKPNKLSPPDRNQTVNPFTKQKVGHP